MITTYEDYLPAEKSLTLEEMAALQQDMISEMGNDEDAIELYEDCLLYTSKNPCLAGGLLYKNGDFS